MHCLSGTPSSMLLIQGTSSGKSAVLQTVGVVMCRVTLIIENTLSLAANQQSKYSSATQNHGPILSYQIDSILDKKDVTNLSNMLLDLFTNINVSLFLYSSPERLTT